MKVIVFTFFFLLIGTISSASIAACTDKKGKEHATGTNIAGYICMPDGRWKKADEPPKPKKPELSKNPKWKRM